MRVSLHNSSAEDTISIKVKGADLYIPPLIGKPEQQQFTIQSAYWPALAEGGAAQLAAAHCPNERPLDLL